MDVALTYQIPFLLSASNIASPSPYFMIVKFLSIVNPVLSVPLYSPDAIMIVSKSIVSVKASFSVLNASSSLVPFPLDVLLPLTYHVILSLVFFKLMVYATVSNLPVMLAFPGFLAVYIIFSSINAVVLSNSPNV